MCESQRNLATSRVVSLPPPTPFESPARLRQEMRQALLDARQALTPREGTQRLSEKPLVEPLKGGVGGRIMRGISEGVRSLATSVAGEDLGEKSSTFSTDSGLESQVDSKKAEKISTLLVGAREKDRSFSQRGQSAAQIAFRNSLTIQLGRILGVTIASDAQKREPTRTQARARVKKAVIETIGAEAAFRLLPNFLLRAE